MLPLVKLRKDTTLKIGVASKYKSLTEKRAMWNTKRQSTILGYIQVIPGACFYWFGNDILYSAGIEKDQGL